MAELIERIVAERICGLARVIRGHAVAALEKKTGKDYEQWIAFTQKSGPKSEEERRGWLPLLRAAGW